MPTYQYACTECGHRFEAVQSFSDAALTQCPVCQGRLRKQYGSVGVVFKGSGFYRTDSRRAAENGSSSTPAKKDAPVKSDSSSSGSGAAVSAGSGSSSGGSSASPSSGS